MIPELELLWEAAMGFYIPRVFDPLDLEVIDRVYETAWAHIEARDPFRNRERDGAREEALRQTNIRLSGLRQSRFRPLCDRVLANIPETWTTTGSGMPIPEIGPSVGDTRDADEIGK